MFNIKYLLYIPLVASIIAILLFVWNLEEPTCDIVEIKVMTTLLLGIVIGLTREICR